jgi:hypothetical protein
MIIKITDEELQKRIQQYQTDHISSVETMFEKHGNINPFMTVLAYHDQEENFRQIHVPIPGMLFSSPTTKQILVEELIPLNLEGMVREHLVPVALSISMEANMRTSKNMDISVDDMMKLDPEDILVHQLETLTGSKHVIYRVIKGDEMVVNEDGDLVDQKTLERFKATDDEDDIEVEGMFTNLLKKFHKKLD